MRVLWVCNVVLPQIAAELHMDAGNKEGWVGGLYRAVIGEMAGQGIQLGFAFPIAKGQDAVRGSLVVNEDYDLQYFGFREDSLGAENYDMEMEKDLSDIMTSFEPDLLHCFGTEYPHTLAAVKMFSRPDRTLIGIQGLCRVYAKGYMANMPKSVVNSVTLRDILRKDSLKEQQLKYEGRGQWELAAVKWTGHVTGRTRFDRYWTQKWNPTVRYHEMQETLRPEFYAGQWSEEGCERHRIFLSQGDYPIKGLHYMLLALPEILEKYPDTQVYVAGNCILRKPGLESFVKLSAYGKYIQKLLKKNHIGDRVHFAGKLNAAEMKEQYLKSQVFVCPSTMENSPNSLGEAMLLGTPVVTADIGGILSMLCADEGYIYEGFRVEKAQEPGELKRIVGNLTKAVLEAFDHPEEMKRRAAKARAHALRTHDPRTNQKRLIEIYREIDAS
ncbi:MAG: glycosyltransferase family 4 protein [Lachnospiraceae bacterium]|nr:glycosyltransferase family 4 protein [Lachnospiraceae bacterium]